LRYPVFKLKAQTGKEKTTMGFLFKTKERDGKFSAAEETTCCRCGKKLKKGTKAIRIDQNVYCLSCGNAKLDWDFLEFHAMIDD